MKGKTRTCSVSWINVSDWSSGCLGDPPDSGSSIQTSSSEVEASVDSTPASATPEQVAVSDSSLRAVQTCTRVVQPQSSDGDTEDVEEVTSPVDNLTVEDNHGGSDHESLVENNGCGPGVTGDPFPPAAGDSIPVSTTVGSLHFKCSNELAPHTVPVCISCSKTSQ